MSNEVEELVYLSGEIWKIESQRQEKRDDELIRWKYPNAVWQKEIYILHKIYITHHFLLVAKINPPQNPNSWTRTTTPKFIFNNNFF